MAVNVPGLNVICIKYLPRNCLQGFDIGVYAMSPHMRLKMILQLVLGSQARLTRPELWNLLGPRRSVQCATRPYASLGARAVP
jgi:hypothetical protein